MRKFLVVFVGLALAACGGGSGGVSGPSGPTYPQVAGSYTGNADVYAAGIYLGQAPMTMAVTQSGASVTITSTIFDMALNPITGTIDGTGFFTPTAGGGAPAGQDATCGTYVYTAASLSFNASARTLTYGETMLTDWCGEVRLSATLRR